MRVKKLEIFGFKSFSHRQSVIFDEGVTAIVGPNGCGKSNVVDALRWVMGEQNPRHLRGGSMQDIIFCGSEKKAPLGFAEVTLTIENNKNDAPLEYNHFNEIQITRRLYKTGESEYEINRQKARLKDILDFFLGTGVGTKAYSIIEQGRVNDIISAKPQDRRIIIEEAAGITKYKAKKIAAERRIEQTKINLNRIVDIKNEVDKRAAALLREKEKFIKVQAIKNKIRKLDLHVTSHQYLFFSAQHSFLLNQLNSLKDDTEKNARDFAIAEDNFSKILEEYAKKHDQKRLLEELKNQHNSSLELLKKDLEYTKATFNDNQILVTRITSQLDDIEKVTLDLETEIKNLETEYELCHKQLLKVEDDLKQKKLTGQSVIEKRQKNLNDEREMQKKLLESATTAARLQTEIAALKKQDLQQQNDIKNIKEDISVRSEELSSAKNHLNNLEFELEHGLNRAQAVEDKLNSIEERLNKEREIETYLKNQLRGLKEQQLTISSRLKSLQEIDHSLEWSPSGASDILSSDIKHLVKSVIADVIHVKPGFEDTVEKCLFFILDALVLENQNDLSSAVSFLKDKKSAKTSFFFLNQTHPDIHMENSCDLMSLGDLIIIPDKQFHGLKSHFARIYLAQNLSLALLHWHAARINQITIVTKEGEMLLPDGQAIILGQNNKHGVLQRKKELASLENKMCEAESSINNIMISIEKPEKNIAIFEHEQKEYSNEVKMLNNGIIRLEEVIKQKNIEHDKMEAELKKLIDKQSHLNQTQNNFDDKIVDLNALWSNALNDHKNYEENFEQIKAERTVVDMAYETYQNQIKEIEIIKAGCQKKSESLVNALALARKNIFHYSTQKQAFLEQIEEKSQEELKLLENERQIKKKTKAINKDLEETIGMFFNLVKECENLAQKKYSKEKEVADLKSQGQVFLEKLHTLKLSINNADHEIKNLCERIMERYRIKLTEQICDFHHKPIDENAAKKEMKELHKSYERMGSVNENAAHEFAEFETRSKFLNAQIDDLNDALTQLEAAIKKINKTTKIRFLEAFNSINKQFSLVFPRLFNGGQAELILCDQEDLLTSGVDIMAKPPGKNIGSIELMSGGEKALTAISLIMAIFLIKPSPFCLLDEVDAPLDEANVSRFGQLIKDMSELSQFIVITHNRKTMESADQLYGVTMEEAGQSKIVCVHIQEAFEALKQTKSSSRLNKETQLFLDDIIA
jgi:chromosome segregation protein